MIKMDDVDAAYADALSYWEEWQVMGAPNTPLPSDLAVMLEDYMDEYCRQGTARLHQVILPKSESGSNCECGYCNDTE